MNLEQAKESARRVWQACDDLGEMARLHQSEEAAELEHELRKLAWKAQARVAEKQREEANNG